MATNKNWAAIRVINKRRKAKAVRDAVSLYVRGMGSPPTESDLRLYSIVNQMTKAEKLACLREGSVCFSLLSDAALWRRGQL